MREHMHLAFSEIYPHIVILISVYKTRISIYIINILKYKHARAGTVININLYLLFIFQ